MRSPVTRSRSWWTGIVSLFGPSATVALACQNPTREIPKRLAAPLASRQAEGRKHSAARCGLNNGCVFNGVDPPIGFPLPGRKRDRPQPV